MSRNIRQAVCIFSFFVWFDGDFLLGAVCRLRACIPVVNIEAQGIRQAVCLSGFSISIIRQQLVSLVLCKVGASIPVIEAQGIRQAVDSNGVVIWFDSNCFLLGNVQAKGWHPAYRS